MTRNPQKLQQEVPWQQPLRQRSELSDRRLVGGKNQRKLQ